MNAPTTHQLARHILPLVAICTMVLTCGTLQAEDAASMGPNTPQLVFSNVQPVCAVTHEPEMGKASTSTQETLIAPEKDRNAWRTQDTVRELAFAALTLADWGMTLDIGKRYPNKIAFVPTTFTYPNGTSIVINEPVHLDTYSESNPILGKYPHRAAINEYMAAVLIGHVVLAKALPVGYRGWFQSVTIGLEVYSVSVDAFSAGLSFNF